MRWDTASSAGIQGFSSQNSTLDLRAHRNDLDNLRRGEECAGTPL